MLHLPRKRLIGLGCALALVLILLSLLVPAPVRADVGVQPVLPVGSSLKPDAETPVQMAAEVVRMTVRQGTAADNASVKLNPQSYGYDVHPVWFRGMAEVEADFTMKNPAGEAVSMTVWFPLASALEKTWDLNPDESVPRIESFRVALNGSRLDYAVSDWPNPKGAGKPPLPWASFPVTFPPGEDTLIHVSYVLPLQPIPKQPALALTYVLQTGAGWAGPIGQAELILDLPYPASDATLANLPAGAALEGNQARWTWKNFEPGPQNDFSVWVLPPDSWQGLEAARARAQTSPQDGQTWLDLAAVYNSLSVDMFSLRLMRFGPVYLPLSIEAYQQAAELMPDHPAPHAGLGLLNVVKYWNDKNRPAAYLQFAQNECQIARELDARDPALLEGAGSSKYLLVWLEEALYPYNDATATAEAAQLTAASPTLIPTDTARPTHRPTFTRRPTRSATPTLPPTQTPMPLPSATPLPPTAAPSAAPETAGNGLSPFMLAAAGVIGVGIAGYLVAKGLRKRARKG